MNIILKNIVLSSIILLGVSSLSLGSESDLSIDAQIEAIKNAPPQKRVELMNDLKRKLANINRQERAKIISRMRAEMQAHKAPKTHNEEMSKNRAHDMAQEQQIQMQEDIMHKQNMHQKHTGDRHFNENVQNRQMPKQEIHRQNQMPLNNKPLEHIENHKEQQKNNIMNNWNSRHK